MQVLPLAGLAILAVFAQSGLAPARAAALPTTIGACSETAIKEISHRLENPDSGSVVQYVNGSIQISYDVIAAVHRSHVGNQSEGLSRQYPEE
jgi:hypothetical protein